MFSDELRDAAARLERTMRAEALMLATAESCTGGLLAGLLTEIPGSSDILERGFVTYSNEAKIACLGVHPDLIQHHGAVSPQVARAMAEGALIHSEADIAVAVTGVAGPGGGTDDKPIGLVHLATARLGMEPILLECRFGDVGRSAIRLASVKAALGLVLTMLERSSAINSD